MLAASIHRLSKELPGGSLGVEVDIGGPARLVQGVAALVLLPHPAVQHSYIDTGTNGAIKQTGQYQRYGTYRRNWS